MWDNFKGYHPFSLRFPHNVCITKNIENIFWNLNNWTTKGFILDQITSDKNSISKQNSKKAFTKKNS